MPEPLRLRLRGGPLGNTCCVEDAETGRPIKAYEVRLDPVLPGKPLTAVVRVWIDEADIEFFASHEEITSAQIFQEL